MPTTARSSSDAVRTPPAIWTASGVLFSAASRRQRQPVAARGLSGTGQAVEHVTRAPDIRRGIRSRRHPPTTLDASRSKPHREGYVSLTLPLDANAGRADRRHRPPDVLGRAGRRPQQPGRCRPPARLSEEPRERERDLGEGPADGARAAPRDARRRRASIRSSRTTARSVAYSVRDGLTRGRICRADLRWHSPGRSATSACCTGWFADNRRILALDGLPGGHDVRAIDVVDRTEADLVTASDDPHRSGRPFARRPLARRSARSDNVWIAPVRPGNSAAGTRVGHGPRASTQARPNARAGGRRMDVCCICCSNATASETSTRSGSIRRAARQSESPSSSQHLHDPRRRWGRHPSAPPSSATRSCSLRSR